MKSPLVVMIIIVVGIIGFLAIYSQTGIPERPLAGAPASGGYGAKAGGYGASAGGYGAKAGGYGASSAGTAAERDSKPYANPQLLASTGDIEKNAGKWTVLDCRDKAKYEAGHIPGAVSLGDSCQKALRDDREIKGAGVIKYLKLKPVEALEKIIGKAGIALDRTVVIYSDMEETLSGYTYVPFWVLEYLGHKDVRVLDGGIEEWEHEKRQIEKKENKPSPSQFKAQVVQDKLATTDEILRIAKGEIKGVQLVDARLPVEHSGEHKAPPGHDLYDKVKRSGKIPGTTVNVPHYFQFDKTPYETRKMKGMAELEKLYSGLDRGKRTIMYCYISNRASFGYFVLRLMGFSNPANYHDGWIVWGNDQNLPVETTMKK